MMDAIILAAGKGTRLRPYTESTPKPLLDLQGRPILDWILGALPPVQRLIVVVNYLAEQIEAYLARQHWIQHWQVVYQDQPRGTGDALLACQAAVRADRVLVLNGDDLIGRSDLARLCSEEVGILAHPVSQPESFGIIFRHPDGTLAKIVEKPAGLSAPQLANIGAYVFPRAVFHLKLPLSPRGEYEITDAVSQLAARQPFPVVEAAHWLPIGTVDAWHAAQTADLRPYT
jgi:NDP-sugar pyrophosphorylase family protein